jgi:hypothetical protein
MAKKNRKSLKNAFRQGAQPTEDSFGDVIDSALNVVDDGFDKTDKDGFKITQLGTSGKLMSFYENVAVRDPAWSVRLGQESRQLIVGNERNQPALTVSAGDESQENRIGVNKANPDHALDVEGVVAAHGRLGAHRGTVKADGTWQTIAGPFDGCHAFEVMAGVGEKQTGRYALLHSIVINTFNRNPTIDSRQSHYGSRCDRLRLRWAGDTNAYRLEIRTRCAYGEHIAIQYQLTDLWFDPFMQACDTKDSGAP